MFALHREQVREAVQAGCIAARMRGGFAGPGQTQRQLPRRSRAQAVVLARCRHDNTLALHDRIGQAGRDGTVVRSHPGPPDHRARGDVAGTRTRPSPNVPRQGFVFHGWQQPCGFLPSARGFFPSGNAGISRRNIRVSPLNRRGRMTANCPPHTRNSPAGTAAGA